MSNARIGKRYLAAEPKEVGRILNYVAKPVSRTRQDIDSWNKALQLCMSDEPKNYALQLLYNEAGIDALLASQMQNRKQQVLATGFTLKTAKGEVDEEQTLLLKNLPSYRANTNAMLDTIPFGYNLVELAIKLLPDKRKDVDVLVIPRTNVVPQKGLFYSDYTDDKNVKYREMPEYGRFILEYNTGDIGLINKAMPHVLFKRFAQSCWSELCEIYGIPPRYMKTNTSDPKQLDKADQMMRDMGAAAYFIIDKTEEFDFAEGVATNGDVYKNLINLCNNEISMIISGAIIGQDTVNGNRSKDESAQNMLRDLIESDMAQAADWWTNVALPAYAANGILKPGLYFEYSKAEDVGQLFKFTQGLLPFKKVDNDWLKDKFGVEVIGDIATADNAQQNNGDKLTIGEDFFV